MDTFGLFHSDFFPNYMIFLQPYNDFICLLDDFNLVQMVSEPTRLCNTLDLFLTSKYCIWATSWDYETGLHETRGLKESM